MEPFTKPVDTTEFPMYGDIVVHPVDFSSLERNIKRKFYGSTEAFSSDAKWIVHNSVIFNGGKCSNECDIYRRGRCNMTS